MLKSLFRHPLGAQLITLGGNAELELVDSLVSVAYRVPHAVGLVKMIPETTAFF